MKKTEFRPFHIGANDATIGPRIGGPAPVGVKPKSKDKHTRYLLTLPLDDGGEFSIFYGFDFLNPGGRNPFDMAYQLFEESNHLIQVVQHESVPRDEKDRFHSEIPSQSLILAPQVKIEKSVYEFHKIGGIPFFTREFDSVILDKCLSLLDDSFIHLVQLAFPVGPNDAVLDCDWPFGDAVFHLFGKQTDKALVYRYCWG